MLSKYCKKTIQTILCRDTVQLGFNNIEFSKCSFARTARNWYNHKRIQCFDDVTKYSYYFPLANLPNHCICFSPLSVYRPIKFTFDVHRCLLFYIILNIINFIIRQKSHGPKGASASPLPTTCARINI